MPGQGLDTAMVELRDAKVAIRDLWVEEVLYRRQLIHDVKETLYLTLCGTHAIDIKLLIDKGILRLAENGKTIHENDSNLVVAVEKSARSATLIKEQFPGLNVIERDLHQVLHIDDPLKHPEKSVLSRFQARVVNLDYDSSARLKQGHLEAVEAARKIARIQAQDPHEWSLLLTLNSTINWPPKDQRAERDFLRQYSWPSDSTRDWLVDHDAEGCTLRSLDLRTASYLLQQAFLATSIPMRIADAVIGEGWRLAVHKLFIYGGGPEAPMVSFMFRLFYDKVAENYRIAFLNAVESSLASCIEIW